MTNRPTRIEGEPENPIEMPDTTEELRATDAFEAVWQRIKSWDVNVPEAYSGYCGANGSHVALILAALRGPITEIAYQAAGAASVPFMKDHPDYVMPTEAISEGVEAVLADLYPVPPPPASTPCHNRSKEPR